MHDLYQNMSPSDFFSLKGRSHMCGRAFSARTQHFPSHYFMFARSHMRLRFCGRFPHAIRWIGLENRMRAA
jgi:hypothetical protein